MNGYVRGIMSEKLDAGAAYLASLKLSSSPSTAAAREHSSKEPDPPRTSGSLEHAGTPHFVKADKRKSPRYRCQGSARLQELNSGISLWATFTDISLHGCYIEAATPLRVGAHLNLRLEANGFRFEAEGEVRVAYPGVGMGVSFTNMSEENRDQLRELVRFIARPAMILNSRVSTQSLSVSEPDAWRAVANPATALQAIFTFFENRHMMGREEFLRILRNSQKSGK
jgi:hypothetical protein